MESARTLTDLATPAPGHLPHAEFGAPDELAHDCRRAQANLGLSIDVAPSIRFEDFPTDLPKQEINVTAAAARLAAAYYAD